MQGSAERLVSPERAILDAAKELFCSRGFAGTSVTAIGEKAGISAPAIYRHFKGKDELLVALCFEALDSLIAEAREAGPDPRRDLERLIRNHARRLLRDRALASLYYMEYTSLEPVYARLLNRRLERYVGQWTEVMTRCWPDRDRELITEATYAVFGSASSVLLWPEHILEAELDFEDVIVATSLAAVSVLDREPVGL